MTYKAIDPSDYEQQLRRKAETIAERFKEIGVAQFDTYRSEPIHYRMRAEFRVWHEGDDLYYIMFNPETREKIRKDEFLPGSQLINQLMQAVREFVLDKPVLRNKLFQVDFLTTTSNQAIVSVLYHRQLDDEWRAAAERLRQHLQQLAEVVHLVGRARKQKVVLGSESVIENVQVNGKVYQSIQTENSFTQPNAGINEKMIGWVTQHSGSTDHDLLELYCGNGNFTLPLADHFRQVLATEISKSSVAAARESATLNNIDNVTVVRMSAEDFSEALQGRLTSRRIEEADIGRFDCRTVLVDPPRAGLDELALSLVRRYSRIIYVSCNPETLIDNVKSLSDEFYVSAAAIFDQFPYTDHIESGIILERKSAS
ncbi:tRNA (uridine(54)-C5)-methyltransferase TrmA [Idiomarina seosinensis]|uniref:tRNA/tmRNA (uracil-C(5))-methyltransferase n=1 Tax=Idiomarina seosinensis TaxID=281739 RepID=A0A432Z7B2_9GAMM|nr:tRNA (uridine(54)-C5)-methyltransferase TrmA [Idiomarina seosinensis]RUO73777.1 tRNA (uridine(54)-C5)-methyltransferase TrmA [Idiomarina seosinensis]